MSISLVNTLYHASLQSILGPLQNLGLSAAGTSSSQATSGQSTNSQDRSGLSPFAQVLNTLQQLQQSNPTEYQQVTQQIGANLKSAAQAAQTGGNSTAASQLNQLATDFSNASSNGQLPNIQDLAQAIGGHHHGHHFHGFANQSNGVSTSGGNTNQLASAVQANGYSSGTFDPASIILNTLSSAGITG